MEVAGKLCNGREYIFDRIHLEKTRPMLMKIFISRLCVVINMLFFVRESVIVPILCGEYKIFLCYFFVPQHAFIGIRRFDAIYYDVV